MKSGIMNSNRNINDIATYAFSKLIWYRGYSCTLPPYFPFFDLIYL